MTADPIARCAQLIREADGLVVCAGAGMGVDSGLPDFRGAAGFWRAYPALAEAGIRFEAIANPAAFERDPELAWGFYGHRLTLYRETKPHAGFRILLEIGARLAHGTFVFTSNVDGQFQKAGFPGERVCECHGSIHLLQCMKSCVPAIWPADALRPQIDAGRCRIVSPMPGCPHCGGLARPNILMFGDWDWLPERSQEQERRLSLWRAALKRPVAIEIGAGSHVPTVRRFSESLGAPLIRINPTEPEIPAGEGVALAMGGLAALGQLRARLTTLGFLA